MIWRFLAALRRLVRDLTTRNEFSASWHRDQERASWQAPDQFVTWKPEFLKTDRDATVERQ